MTLIWQISVRSSNPERVLSRHALKLLRRSITSSCSTAGDIPLSTIPPPLAPLPMQLRSFVLLLKLVRRADRYKVCIEVRIRFTAVYGGLSYFSIPLVSRISSAKQCNQATVAYHAWQNVDHLSLYIQQAIRSWMKTPSQFDLEREDGTHGCGQKMLNSTKSCKRQPF